MGRFGGAPLVFTAAHGAPQCKVLQLVVSFTRFPMAMARALLVFPTVIPTNSIGQGLDVPNSTHIRRRREAVRPAAVRALALFVLALTMTPVASALALPDGAGLLGADYSSVQGRVTKGFLGAAVFGFEDGGFLSAAGSRYTDDLTGDGVSLTAGIGAPLRGAVLGRAFGTRWIGENDFRAWGLKAGPFVQWTGGASLGLSFVRQDEGNGATATGGIVEATVPIAARWSALASGTAASLGRGGESASGSAGILWQAGSRLEVQAEGGVAKNGTLGTTTSGASGGGRGLLGGLPLLGRGQGDASAAPQGEVDEKVSGTFTMGIRVVFP